MELDVYSGKKTWFRIPEVICLWVLGWSCCVHISKTVNWEMIKEMLQWLWSQFYKIGFIQLLLFRNQFKMRNQRFYQFFCVLIFGEECFFLCNWFTSAGILGYFTCISLAFLSSKFPDSINAYLYFYHYVYLWFLPIPITNRDR